MEELRKTGIDIIGDVSWGTHFCQFYQTKQDLIDTLVPYFKAGLKNNEYCMWVTAEPLATEEARQALSRAMPRFSSYFKKGQIDIMPYTEWHMKGGSFNARRVMNVWLKRLESALTKGYDGLRVAGNTFWLERRQWKRFVDYEAQVNAVIGNRRILAMCSYSLNKCSTTDVMDVIRTHEFALIKQEDKWQLFESSGYKATMRALVESQAEIAHLASFPELNPNPVLEVDMAGNIKYLNPAAKKRFPDLSTKGKEHPFLANWESLADTIRSEKLPSLTRDIRFGESWYEQMVYYVPSTEHFRIYAWDITERKKAEEALRKAQEELQIRVQESTEELREANKILQAEIADRKRAQAEMQVRAKQQAVVAQLGQLALAGASLDQLFHEAVKQVARTIKVEYCKLLELLPGEKELLLRAGVGWKQGLVGHATVGAGTDSQAGYTLLSDKPVIVEDLRKEKRFSGPPLLQEHGVVSGVSVIVLGQDKLFGVLGAHTTRRRKFTRDDIYFLQAVANVLAGTIKRKNVEEKFRFASLYNRSLIEASLDPLVTIDVLGRITDVNAATELATGFQRDDLIGKDFSDYFTEPEKARSGYQQVFRDGSVRDYALEIRRRDGHVTPVLYNASVYRDESGKVIGIFAAARDITERRQAEEAVRAERQRFNDVLEILPAYLVLLTRDYHVPFANRFFRERFGESHGRRCFEYLFGRTEPCEICETYKVLKTMTPLEWQWTGPDGRNYYVFDFPFTDTDGSTLIMEVGIDVTEQKRAEAALREAHDELEIRVQERTKELAESEDKYRNIVETASEGILIIDLDGIITFANQRMAELLGYARKELLGKVAMDFMEADQKAAVLAAREELKKGSRIQREFRFHRKDGSVLWTNASVSPLLDKQGHHFANLVMYADITERKQAQEELQESQQDLNRAQAVASIGSWRLDVGHNELLWSDETYRMFGIPKGTPLTYETFLSAVHLEDRDLVDQKWAAALKGEPYDIEHRIVVGNEVKWVREKAELEVDEHWVAKGGFGTVQNITERKQTEEALRETRDYLENLINYANAPIIVWDPDFRITRFNRAFERLTGLRAEDVLGKKLDILFPQERRVESVAHIRRAVAGERWEVVEIPILHTYGTIRTVLWNSATLYAPDGKTAVATIAQGQDITERKQAEETLRETRDFLNNLLDYANAPIIVWDTSFHITRFNHAFERLTGYAANKVLGKALGILFPEDSREESLRHIRDAMSGRRWEVVEIPILHKDGTVRIVLWNSATLYHQDGKTPIATIAQGQDITERKQAEEALLYMTNELARSNAELEQFAYVASHDLQEPLRMVSSYVQLLADRYKGKLDQDADDFIRYAHDGALRMQRLITDLLAYSRIGTRGGTFEQANLEAVLAQALSNLEVAISENDAIITHDSLPVVRGDAVQLTQLFQNLIDNAIKFHGEEAPQIHVSSGLRGSEWVLSVRDNGIGIAPEYFDRIFLLFQRLHPRQKYPGTGIGLAICKRIVERHGGQIWVESKSDEGSTFCFTIPSSVPRSEK